MSDAVTPAANEQQEPTAPNGPVNDGTPAPEADSYRERYENLRPQYDRTMQELQQLRQQQDRIKSDPEAQREFLTELGFELPDDDEPDPLLDDDALAAIARQFDKRFSAIEERFTQQDTQAQVARGEAHFEKTLADIASNRGFAFSEEEQDAVFGMALNLPPTQDGLPDFKSAYERLEKGFDQRQQHWAQTKQTTHRVSPAGGPGGDAPDLDDPETRRRWMAERLNELNASS